jgi:hypothetical protein
MANDGSNSGDNSSKTALRRVAALSNHLLPGLQQPATPVVKYGHPFQQDMETHGSGVLAYGLETHGRDPLRRTWKPPIDEPGVSTHPFAKTADMQETQGTVTVDTLNNRSWREFPQRGERSQSLFGTSEAYRKPEPELRRELEEFSHRETKEMGPQAQTMVADFQQQLLAHPRYSPFRFKAENPHDHMRRENIDDPVEYGQLEGRKVLFELAGLDTASAASKANVGRQDSSGRAQLRSITNSELRKAFRHDVSDASLQFYKEGQRVKAPWESGEPDRPAWTRYMGKRLDKYIGLGLQVDLQKAGAAKQQQGHRAMFREFNRQISAFKAQAKATPTTKS